MMMMTEEIENANILLICCKGNTKIKIAIMSHRCASLFTTHNYCNNYNPVTAHFPFI